MLERIVAVACPEEEQIVIEIGPGKGALTRYLLPRAGRLIAIELDPALAAGLRTRFASEPNFEVLEGDVLSIDLTQWGQAVVVGNLPYYITSPILEQTLALGPLCRRAVFLVQKEVAERLAAQPGSRDYGFLTVRTQATADVSLVCNVPAKAFQPPPKVDSAVVRLIPKPQPADEGFLRFASAAFRQKRKTLRNNLSALYGSLAPDAFPEAGLRAEQLSIPQLEDLYRRLSAPRAVY